MRKLIKLFVILVLVWGALGAIQLLKDRETLKNDIIRLHVVANSDTKEDQSIKLVVKDKIVSYLQGKMDTTMTQEEALSYLQENLGTLEEYVNTVLKQIGSGYCANVSLQKEAFGKRIYETFCLPSGIYEALRVNIGKAEGQNWWCVVFPSLCLSASTEDFRDTAVSSGFGSELTNTLSGEGGYKIRFYLLDCIGKLENFFIFH